MPINDTKKYPLTNDIIFKAVYGREEDACEKALISMLNLILDKHNREKIVSVEIKNPMNNPSSERGKESILDIKCKTDTGEIIGVEMQVKRRPYLEKRIIYYQGKKIGDSLNKTEEYATIKKVVTICIMVENIFEGVEKFHSKYRYKDIESGRELSEVSEVHFIELSKIDRKKEVEEMSQLERYGLYLLYANDDAQIELMKAVKSFEDEVIVMTEPILRKVTADEKIKQAADDREMFLWELEIDKIERDQEIQQAKQEIKQAKQEIKQTKQKMQQAKQKMQQTEQKMQQTEQKMQQTEQKMQQTEQKMQQTEQKMQQTEQKMQQAEQARREAVIKMKERDMLPEDIAEIMGIPIDELELFV